MTLNEVLKSIPKMNVSYTTLNRWENNRTSPSRLAIIRIADYCSEKNLPQDIMGVLKHS